MENICNSIADLIGRTPMVRLHKVANGETEIIAKMEMCNPSSSIKVRIAWAMVEEAEKSGKLKPGSLLIEPSSGNSGIGLALVAAVKGYRLIITMPESMTIERRSLLSAYGAEVVLTPASGGMDAAVAKADEIHLENPGSMLLQQFKNQVNPICHEETTGVEIYEDAGGKIDYFISGIGTGGTITGVGRALKKRNPDVKIIAIEPEESPLISKGYAGEHKMQGIGVSFIPETLDASVIDEFISISAEAAGVMANKVAKEEGVLVGITGGAVLHAAAEISKREEAKNKRIVVLLADSGERYLSSWLFQ